MLNKNIHTERTLLRKYKVSDKEAMVKLFMDKVVNKYMGNGPSETREDALELFDRIKTLYENPLSYHHFEIWAIQLDDQFIGHFELKQSKYADKNELEVVYMLDERHWGKELMPEILNAINLHAQSLDQQLIATINPENKKTVRALEKVGIERQKWVGEGDDRCLKVWIMKP